MHTAAVILAAGRGSRLLDETGECSKALLTLGPRSLSDPTPVSFLRRQIELLQALDVGRITVVVGYQREQVMRELTRWAPGVRVVINATPDIRESGSLHSFQLAVRDGEGVLDGRSATLLMDADVVYHREALRRLLAEPRTAVLVCDRHTPNPEEVLVLGTPQPPRFLGKGLTPRMTGDAEVLGEATGIVQFHPREHALARQIIDWLLGDPDAPAGSLVHRGFGPARRATEHEELSDRLLRLGRMSAVLFPGEELPFMEVDTPQDLQVMRQSLYPRLLQMESGNESRFGKPRRVQRTLSR